MKELQLIAFKKKEIQEVANLLELDLRNIKCTICRKKLKIENIGMFVRYKKKGVILCDNTSCFSKWVIEEKPELFESQKKKQGDEGDE